MPHEYRISKTTNAQQFLGWKIERYLPDAKFNYFDSCVLCCLLTVLIVMVLEVDGAIFR